MRPHAKPIAFFLLTLRNVLIINEDELLVSLPTTNMEDHPEGCSRLFIQYIHINLLGPYLQAVSSTCVGHEPCCGDRDRLSNNISFVRLEIGQWTLVAIGNTCSSYSASAHYNSHFRRIQIEQNMKI
jgi:hypothetical protein